MKNLHSEDYLLISKMFSKEKTSENVIMQNVIILKKTIKTKKKSMKKNLSDSKTELDVQDKKLQNIIKKCVNIKVFLKTIINQKMCNIFIK